MKTNVASESHDSMILIVIALCVFAFFGMLVVVHFALGPDKGPSMYNDAIQIHEGPSRGPTPRDSQDE